jgi:hypothetical protein
MNKKARLELWGHPWRIDGPLQCFEGASVFGKVICQAGAFKMYGDDFSIYEFVDGVMTKPLKIWMKWVVLIFCVRRIYA